MISRRHLVQTAKEQGSRLYSLGRYDEAASAFSLALEHARHDDPDMHLYYSNRSACYIQMKQYSRALLDGKMYVECKPQWCKAHARLAFLYVQLGMLEEARREYEVGQHLVRCTLNVRLRWNWMATI